MLRGATTVPTKLVSTNQIQKDLRCMSQASIVQILSMQGDEEDIVEEEQQGSCSMAHTLVQLISKERNIGRCLQDSTKVSTVSTLRTRLLLMAKGMLRPN